MTQTSQTKHSIADLRIYQLALALEEQVYELVKSLPDKDFETSNNLRRASAGVAHFIFESHRQYSYKLKMESLHGAREQAEVAIKFLEEFEQSGQGKTSSLRQDYTSLVKQSWGLIKWLKQKQIQKDTVASAQAKDQLVEARS